MTGDTSSCVYYRSRWPEEIVPAGEPLWMYDEVDLEADCVLRTVDVFPDGTITRNSIEIDQPKDGRKFSSLLDVSWVDIDQSHFTEISRDEFERLYARAVDRPFWFPKE